ncbi:MAG: disulfide bond formation protein B [Bdellovibrionales bacterium]|nr:disulfide bond formation protein B [Bdellovibrionales bacterium]
MKSRVQWITFYCWIVATLATLGSLFFSEVMKFPPCVLCWYQRIAMYPLVLLFLVGSFQGGRATFAFSLPLVIVGWITALYHNLLHYKIVPESASPCLQGVSCSTVYINWLGFITIPMLSFIAFSILLMLLVLLKKEIANEK